MDLKKYRENIRNELLQGVNQQAVKQTLMKTGNYTKKTTKKHVDLVEDEIKRVRQPMKRAKPSAIIYNSDRNAHYTEGTSGSDDEASVESMPVVGGKMPGIKSLKKLGSDIVSGSKSAANDLASGTKKVVIATAAKELGTNIYSGLKSGAQSLMSEAPIAAEEALPVAEEAAPLLLAAGVKKPRKKRVVSEKEQRRHALIRKLMQKHKCTLAEASNHIKKNNINY